MVSTALTKDTNASMSMAKKKIMRIRNGVKIPAARNFSSVLCQAVYFIFSSVPST